jgi:hypothetical protein
MEDAPQGRVNVACNPVYPFFLRVKIVEAQLKAGYQVNNQAGADAQRKSCNIDNAVNFIPGKIAPGYFEVVPEHSGGIMPNRRKNMPIPLYADNEGIACMVCGVTVHF